MNAPLRTPRPGPAGEIADELRQGAHALNVLADIADMTFATGPQSQKEEAAAFAAFLGEVARPLDDMLRRIMQTAADNVGPAMSPNEVRELARLRLVSDAFEDNWRDCFCDPGDEEPHTRRYVAALRKRRWPAAATEALPDGDITVRPLAPS